MNHLNMYKETSIKTAGGGQLIVMLYDEAIKQIDKAHTLLEKEGQYDKINSSILKAQEIITELSASLDFEGGKDIANSLFSLYMFFNQQLMSANIGKDPSLLKPVRDMLFDLRGAWKQIENTKENPPKASVGINIAG